MTFFYLKNKHFHFLVENGNYFILEQAIQSNKLCGGGGTTVQMIGAIVLALYRFSPTGSFLIHALVAKHTIPTIVLVFPPLTACILHVNVNIINPFVFGLCAHSSLLNLQDGIREYHFFL